MKQNTESNEYCNRSQRAMKENELEVARNVRVLPTAVKAGLLLSTQKNTVNIDNLTHELYQDILVESEEVVFLLRDRKDVTQLVNFVKNAN